jgi:hypothetical protein
MGEWTAAVHKKITLESVNNVRIYTNILHKKNFIEGLQLGSIWPDFPDDISVNTAIGHIQGILGIKGSSLTYKSHYGENAYWHSMYVEGKNKSETKGLIIQQILEWSQKARECYRKALHAMPFDQRYANKKIKEAGFHLGKALHIIEDSYTNTHTKRDGNINKIIKFFDYNKQTSKEHSPGDKYSKENMPYYNKAVDAVKIVLREFGNFRLSEKGFSNKLRKILSEQIFVLED